MAHRRTLTVKQLRDLNTPCYCLIPSMPNTVRKFLPLLHNAIRSVLFFFSGRQLRVRFVERQQTNMDQNSGGVPEEAANHRMP